MTEHVVPVAGDTASGVVPRRRRFRRAGAVIAAPALAVLVWVVCVSVAGVDLAVGEGATAMTIGIAPILIVPLLAGGAAWGLLSLLERRARRGRAAWTIIAWTVLVVSLLGPVTMAATLATMVSLIVMHLVVGTTLILGLGGRLGGEVGGGHGSGHGSGHGGGRGGGRKAGPSAPGSL